MNMRTQNAAKRTRGLLCASVLPLVFLAVLFCTKTPALALEVTGVSYNGEPDSVRCQPNEDMWDIAIEFDANVGWADFGAQTPVESLHHIHLQKADGAEVGGWSVHTGTSPEERTVLYLELEEPLEPLQRYRIVIDPELATADGQEALGAQYVTYFTTAPDLACGLTVFQVVGIAAAVVVVVCGVGAGVARRRRGQR